APCRFPPSQPENSLAHLSKFWVTFICTFSSLLPHAQRRAGRSEPGRVEGQAAARTLRQGRRLDRVNPPPTAVGTESSDECPSTNVVSPLGPVGVTIPLKVPLQMGLRTFLFYGAFCCGVFILRRLRAEFRDGETAFRAAQYVVDSPWILMDIADAGGGMR